MYIGIAQTMVTARGERKSFRDGRIETERVDVYVLTCIGAQLPTLKN